MDNKKQRKDGQDNNKAANKVNKPSTNSLKEKEKKRKQIFKPVLDNPYTQVSWPFIEPSVGSTIAESLALIIKPIGDHNKAHNSQSNTSGKNYADSLPLMKKLTIGFNATTEALEDQAQGKRTADTIKYVFVCKYDIAASILVQHFPVLTYTASKGSKTKIKLIQLPKGTASALSEVTGISDTSIIGITGDIQEAEAFYSLFDSVVDVQVPYLDNLYDKEGHFEKSNINFLSTSAPVGGPKRNNQKKKSST